MSFYDAFKGNSGAVEKLKGRFGLPAIRQRTTKGATDPVTRKSAGATTVQTPITVAKRTSEVTDSEGLKTVQTEFVSWDEVQANDTIVFAGRSYTAGNVTLVDPDGEVLVWKVAVRSGA